VFQKITQKVLHIINFEPFARESRFLYQIKMLCSAKIVVYQSTHNLCELVKCFSLSTQKCLHVSVSIITCMHHLHTAHLTVECQSLLIKTLQIEKDWTADRVIVELARQYITRRCSAHASLFSTFHLGWAHKQLYAIYTVLQKLMRPRLR